MAKKNNYTLDIPLQESFPRSSGNEPTIGQTTKFFTSDLQQWIDKFSVDMMSEKQMEVLCTEICTRCQGNEPDINKALHYFNQKKLKRSITIFNAFKNRVSFVYTKHEDGTHLKWYWIRCYL